MLWVRDQTGRFPWRPYYHAVEIDRICERRVRTFLRARHGRVAYPVTTDDLTLLIEQEADDLDLFADLSGMAAPGVEVQGLTTLRPGRRARVEIARELSERSARLARLRTTLAHELGHVLLHQDVIDRQAAGDAENGEAAEGGDGVTMPPCTNVSVGGASRADWMEWQAGYASGALLMPRMAVATVVLPILRRHGRAPHRWEGNIGRLTDAVQGHFLVSDAAALVRLRQLGLVP